MIRGIDHLVIAVPEPFEAVLRAPWGRDGPLDAHRTGGARLVLQPT